MPEIWLRYGTTDVVLDIKFENLSSQVSSPLKPISDEEVKAAIDGVPLAENMLVLATSPSKAAARAVLTVSEAARAKGFSVTVDVPSKIAGPFRTNLTALAGGEAVPINRIEYQSLEERIGRFQAAIVISATSFDPLFGFAGAPTAILRNFFPGRMAEAFAARKDNLPSPGIEGPPLEIALSSMAGISATSVELIAAGAGIAGIHSGPIPDSFKAATSQLLSSSVVEEDPAKCAILSASSEASSQASLSASLNSLWNNIHIVKEGGSAVLLSESREGLGGGALQMIAEGRLSQEQIPQTPYIDGLEHLIFASELSPKYELGLVSTLPRYYAGTRLGFATFSGMNDVLQKLPEKFGKSYRAIVISDADVTLLRPRT